MNALPVKKINFAQCTRTTKETLPTGNPSNTSRSHNMYNSKEVHLTTNSKLANCRNITIHPLACKRHNITTTSTSHNFTKMTCSSTTDRLYQAIKTTNNILASASLTWSNNSWVLISHGSLTTAIYLKTSRSQSYRVEMRILNIILLRRCRMNCIWRRCRTIKTTWRIFSSMISRLGSRSSKITSLTSKGWSVKATKAQILVFTALHLTPCKQAPGQTKRTFRNQAEQTFIFIFFTWRVRKRLSHAITTPKSSNCFVTTVSTGPL